MGSVYIAKQHPIDRLVAVKVLLSKLAEEEIAVKRFEQEARAISKMQHPNTVTIYDFGQVEDSDGGDRLYIVMELLRGVTLTRALRKGGPLPGPRASRILRQVCSSLADAHGAGIIHRDLKPDNIFLCELGGETDWVKVLDFGVAKLATSESAGTLTQTGMIFGTPKYMSPEQAEGKPIDYRADIYALGVVLYELLAGKPPFVSDTPVGLLLKHISEPPPPISQIAPGRVVDPGLEAIVMRALEKNPDRRQQQVTELAAELEQYERQTGPVALPDDLGRHGSIPPGLMAPSGRVGLPTEVVPGTLPGEAMTPAGLLPPDHVPADLSGGGSGSLTAQGTRGHSATAVGAPQTAAALTAPVASGRLDTFGQAAPPRPKSPKWPWMFAGGTAAVLVSGALIAPRYMDRSVEVVTLRGGEPAEALGTVPSDDAALPEAAEVVPEKKGGIAPPQLDPAQEPAPSTGGREQRTVEVSIQSRPKGALVRLDGRQVGVTPVRIDLPKARGAVYTFELEKRGFEKATEIVTGARDDTVSVRLKRLPRPEPRPRPRCADGSRPPCQKAEEPSAVDLKVDDLK